MFLYRAEIPATEPEQLDTRRVAERVRVNLGHARAHANGLGDLPDAVPLHADLGDVAALRLEP